MKNEGKFKTWLEKRGAIVLPPTNEWEVVRFRTVNGTSVVYTNKNGHLTFTGESAKAYEAFTKIGVKWRPIDRKRKSLRDKKSRIAARDTRRCICCLERLPLDDLTIEHLLSFAHGGTDNLNNLALACEPCNDALGSLPVVGKIEYIIERRKNVAGH